MGDKCDCLCLHYTCQGHLASPREKHTPSSRLFSDTNGYVGKSHKSRNSRYFLWKIEAPSVVQREDGDANTSGSLEADPASVDTQMIP